MADMEGGGILGKGLVGNLFHQFFNLTKEIPGIVRWLYTGLNITSVMYPVNSRCLYHLKSYSVHFSVVNHLSY